MADLSDQPNPQKSRPRYRWPWLVLALVLLGFLLAFFWMNREIQRTRRLRKENPAALTNPPSTRPGW